MFSSLRKYREILNFIIYVEINKKIKYTTNTKKYFTKYRFNCFIKSYTGLYYFFFFLAK